MLLTMRREDFDSLDDMVLGAICFEPIIPMIRGKENLRGFSLFM